MQEIDSKVMSILSELSNLAKNSFGDKLTAVILYGSYARGDYDEYSDVDVMIIADINLSEFSKRQEYLPNSASFVQRPSGHRQSHEY